MHDALIVQVRKRAGGLRDDPVAQLFEGGAVAGEGVVAQGHDGHVVGGLAEPRHLVADLACGVHRHEVRLAEVLLAEGVFGHETPQVAEHGPAREAVAHGVRLVGNLRDEGAALLIGGGDDRALAAGSDDIGGVQGEDAVAVALEGEVGAGEDGGGRVDVHERGSGVHDGGCHVPPRLSRDVRASSHQRLQPPRWPCKTRCRWRRPWLP